MQYAVHVTHFELENFQFDKNNTLLYSVRCENRHHFVFFRYYFQI